MLRLESVLVFVALCGSFMATWPASPGRAQTFAGKRMAPPQSCFTRGTGGDLHDFVETEPTTEPIAGPESE